MRKILALVLVIAISAPALSAAVWTIDKAHSSVGFGVSHLVISKVKGQFTEFSGTINFDGKDFTKASVDVSIDPKSISTDNEMRDKHLRATDFFATDSLPAMGFKSKKVTAAQDGKFQIVGDLTMRGVTKEVTLNATFNGTVKGMQGETRAGFSASTRINRFDWGVSWSKSLDGGGLVVGNDVDISLELETVQQ